MLTRLCIRNFKRFGDVEVELGNPVVLIGPNNSGKTSAMQALTLWNLGLRRWNEKYKGKTAPEKRPGVTINRRDLVAIPHPSARHLWHDLHVRDVVRVGNRQQTANVRIEITVEGITFGEAWVCGLEFDYANVESFYCRPLRLEAGRHPKRMPVPKGASSLGVAFLPPMSGLAASETRLDQGAVNVRIGEGRTAEVLRNLCYSLWNDQPEKWKVVVSRIRQLFGVTLGEPRYVPERGEVAVLYRERRSEFDLSSSGRGLQQTLLILAYMHANPNSVILLDEPDAHLEILRQRQIYSLIAETARASGSQVIAASHSEVVLNEAAGRDLVIAFVGEPHGLGKKSEVLKALREIGFEQYYLAEQAGWVLYVEGSTDLKILQAFARRLGHARAEQALERPFVRYVGNQPSAAARHFHGLREALPDLEGIALFDRLAGGLPERPAFKHLVWKRREIENYSCSQATLEAYARASAEETAGPLFESAKGDSYVDAMREAIRQVSDALETLGHGSPWGADVKVSDDFLAPLFKRFFEKIGLPNIMAKREFYELVEHVPLPEIDPEVREKLDAIATVAENATRRDTA